jgi:hypothetical protein
MKIKLFALSFMAQGGLLVIAFFYPPLLLMLFVTSIYLGLWGSDIEQEYYKKSKRKKIMKAKDIFTKKNKEFPFAWVDSDFIKYFGDMDVEKGSEPSIVKKLDKTMSIQEIIDELKPKLNSLGELYATLQGLSHDTRTLFFLKDKSGILRLVNALWFDDYDGWCVYTFDVSLLSQLRGEFQLFSGNSRDTKILDFLDARKLESLNSSVLKRLAKTKKILGI